ncbi:Metallo-dependent phosphatase-like protein [Mycena amicta]|nr:Metallo-dependent phosphatase-like protein [Mycena amicta]
MAPKKTLVLPHRPVIASPTAQVQLEYTSEPLPKPTTPESHWTRFVLLSDTHARMCDVPGGQDDVLIHTGDLTQLGRLKELRATMSWLSSLPHKIKIVIAGNHDLALHREFYEKYWTEFPGHRMNDQPESADEVRELLKGPAALAAGIVYLEDEEYRFRVRDGGREWSVYGSPWSPNFMGWAFGYDREDAEALLAKFPKTDILLTHGPPRNVLDLCNSQVLAGCPALASRVQQLKPKLHVFGHIHEARGVYVHRWGQDSRLGAQNAIQLGIDDTEPELVEMMQNDYESESDSGLEEKFKDGLSLGDLDLVVPKVEETIFVNAANFPSSLIAKRSFKPGARLKMGGHGFQPIIVDLLDCD